MRAYRSRYILLFGAVLLSASCMAQVVPPQPDLATPSSAIEPGGILMDISDCSAISAGDTRLAPVAKFCEFALTYRRQLPDFIAQQTTTSHGTSSTNLITAQVTFRQGREQYSHVTINGQHVPSTGTFPRNLRFTSAGEFGSFLVDLFTSPGVTEFKFRKESTLQGIPVAIFEFHIPSGDNKFWVLRDSKGRALRPEFRGEIWLEQQSGRPLREELEPAHLPADSEFASAKTITDYEMTPVGDVGVFLLPAKSETHLCVRQRTVSCMESVLTFHDYRKFAATTRILAGNPEP